MNKSKYFSVKNKILSVVIFGVVLWGLTISIIGGLLTDEGCVMVDSNKEIENLKKKTNV